MNEIFRFKVQNDFLDCFGDPDVLKKPGTDIEDGKCTWLAVSAMELASNKQKGVLVECYGRNGNFSHSQIKKKTVKCLRYSLSL